MTESSKTGTAMADVAGKPVSRRCALASGFIYLGATAYRQVEQKSLAKGDALSLAEFAGILAAKQTPSLIPLCHPISLNRVAVHPVLRPDKHAVEVFCFTEIAERTGVEMEALCGLSIALLTIWDLAKPANPALEIGTTRLLFKNGGKNGTWRHPGGLPTEAEEILERYLDPE